MTPLIRVKSPLAVTIDVIMVLFFGCGTLIEESVWVRLFCLLSVFVTALDLGGTLSNFLALRTLRKVAEEHERHEERMFNAVLAQAVAQQEVPRA